MVKTAQLVLSDGIATSSPRVANNGHESFSQPLFFHDDVFNAGVGTLITKRSSRHRSALFHPFTPAARQAFLTKLD
jgi:hypothetical protein